MLSRRDAAVDLAAWPTAAGERQAWPCGRLPSRHPRAAQEADGAHQSGLSRSAVSTSRLRSRLRGVAGERKDEPFALQSPAIEAGHVGGGGSLIDEDEFLRIKG